MSKKRRRKTEMKAVNTRAQSKVAFLTSSDAYETLCVSGYTSLDKNPEIMAGVKKIAELISSMTLYLMENTDKGDRRIKNELSRQVDITPNRYMSRKTWMESIVMNLLLYGSGNSVVLPRTENGLLADMVPISPSRISFTPEGYGYKICIDGVIQDPADLLHFVFNPDSNYPWKGKGITASIKDIANNLKQAAATEKGFMESKWKPSVIVKVDGMTEEFSSPAGRRKLLNEYIATNEAGEPWLIPADQFSVEQIKPLSLSDLAIADTVELNKRTVAAILGIPPFVLGVGSFDKEAWNNCVSTTIRSYAIGIEQELTRKLLISPNWYWRFNMWSLYSYDVKTVAEVFGGLYTKGIVSGNEVRDKISMSPREGLDDLIILENYIPIAKIGDQLKLKQEG